MQYKRRDYIAKIDYVFYNEGEIRKAVRDKKADPGVHHGKGPSSGGYVSDPTASAALHEIMPIKAVVVDGKRLEKPEKWLRVVSETYSHLKDQQCQIVRSRFRGDSYQVTCMDCHISPATYNRTISDARMYAAAVAAQLGLIQIIKITE